MVRLPDAGIAAWRSEVPGITEVFHARFTAHEYPMHSHHTWTLLIIDEGAVRYDLDRHEHGALREAVTLLPPHVPHNGTSATPTGFRKRVLYLEPDALDGSLLAAAVDHPELDDPVLRQWIDQLHGALWHDGESFEAESRLAFVRQRLGWHLAGRPDVPAPQPFHDTAGNLRDLLDSRVEARVSVTEAARVLGVHPTHAIRSFTRRFGMPPHRYLTSRRVDRARNLLLAGMTPAQVAVATGFVDQAHLTRHFKRVVGIGPGAYRHSSRDRRT